MTAVPAPPQLKRPLIGGDGRLDPGAVAEAVRTLQTYQQQVYNATRQAIVAMGRIAEIEALTQTISNPPTQDEVSAIQAKVNEIIVAANTPIG